MVGILHELPAVVNTRLDSAAIPRIGVDYKRGKERKRRRNGGWTALEGIKGMGRRLRAFSRREI
jgi:hypothetical protein